MREGGDDDHGRQDEAWDPELQKTVAAETPLGRLGEREDVAGAVVLLLAPESRWITGQRVEVTGGYRL